MASLELRVLVEVSGARSTYGLRHDDFARYHSKMARLRKSVGAVQKRSSSAKFVRKPVGAVTSEQLSTKHLLLLAYECERDWAHARLLKGRGAESARQSHHAHKRLAKAVKAANELLRLVETHKVDDRSKAHALVYALVMTGEWEFETGKHERGASTLKAAQSLLSELARTAPSAKEQVVLREQSDSIEPMLRFCAYQLKRDVSSIEAAVPSTMQSTSFEDALRQLKEQDAVQSAEALRFGSLEIPIVVPELVESFQQVDRALSSLRASPSSKSEQKKGKTVDAKRAQRIGPKRMAKFDQALSALSEAEAVASRLRDELTSRAVRTGAPSAQDAQRKTSESVVQAHEYLQYHLNAVRASRDLALIARMQSKLLSRSTRRSVSQSTSAKLLPGVVKLYDNVIMSFESMRDLSIVSDSNEDLVAQSIERSIAALRARRTLYLCRSYALLGRYAESMSLHARGLLYLREEAQYGATEDMGEGIMLPRVSMTTDETKSEYDRTKKDVEKEWYDAVHLGGLDRSLEQALQVGEQELPEKDRLKQREEVYDIAFSYVTNWDVDAIKVKAGLASQSSMSISVSDAASTATTAQDTTGPTKKGWFGFWKSQ